MIEVLERVECESETFVELLKHGNDDDTVRDAARVSHAACSESASPTLINYLAKNDHFTPFGHARYGFEIKVDDRQMIDWLSTRAPGWCISRALDPSAYLLEGSLFNWLSAARSYYAGEAYDFPNMQEVYFEGILRHLMENGCIDSVRAFLPEPVFDRIAKAPRYPVYASPGTWLTLRIKAPVFILRQMMRSNHEIVYNEVSRRYVSDDPVFFVPTQWRRKPKKGIKQGSGEGEVRTFDIKEINEWIAERSCFPFAIDLATAYLDWAQTAEELYKLFIGSGVAPEMARMILPVTHYSEVWMTASPSALNRITGLRSNRGTNNHAQKEIEEVSRAIEHCIESEAEYEQRDRL